MTTGQEEEGLVDRVYAENDIQVDEERQLYVVAKQQNEEEIYFARVFAGDPSTRFWQRGWRETKAALKNVELRRRYWEEDFDTIAGSIVKRQRLRYTDDVLPRVHFDPPAWESSYRELDDAEQEAFLDSLLRALEYFPPLT